MAERGQRLTLEIGGRVEVEVNLTKTSAAPRAAQYETRRVPAGGDAEVLLAANPNAVAGAQASRADMAEAQPFASTLPSAEPIVRAPAAASEERVLHGATAPDGSFVDLTAQLEEIDKRTKLTGMRVEATMTQMAIPAYRVRDAHYIAPAGDGAARPLALLWSALRTYGVVAIVRWTKRTNQAFGAIAARGDMSEPHLVLLEVEWSANLRPVPDRAHLGLALKSITPRERDAAGTFVRSMRAPSKILTAIRDERMAQRAELLEAARAGEAFAVPPAPQTDNEEAEALASALEAAMA